MRETRGEEPLELTTDERIIEARNEFRGTRIGYGEGALWKNGNWKLVRNIWSYRHMLETGHPEHNMLLRHTALASITSITYDCDTRKVLSIAYVDPAADVK